MRAWWIGGLAALLSASPAAAQVAPPAEGGGAERAPAEGGYVPGQGRGLEYGAHLIAPIYLTSMGRPSGGEPLGPGPGAGLHGRLGWELPAGFALELAGGFAFNALPAVRGEPPDRRHVLSRADVALGLRYLLLEATPLVPFVELRVGGRWLWFRWPDGDEVQAAPALALQGGLGLRLEVAPFFGVEGGVLLGYTLGPEALREGFLSLTPFLGVTLFLYDEDD